ncbi:hypothetical protein ACPF4F_002244, partial [Vibrio cholerae]
LSFHPTAFRVICAVFCMLRLMSCEWNGDPSTVAGGFSLVCDRFLEGEDGFLPLLLVIKK